MLKRRSPWQRGLGLVADAFRVLGSPGLNLRKSLWIRRGRRGVTAPCQHPSDSGRAGETQCLAAAGWSNPHRLAFVCPHVRVLPDGSRRCGVDAASVRPFWGRSLGLWGGLLVAGWLGLTGLGWMILWKTGVRASYLDVAWPGGWRQVEALRAQRYVQLAEIALSSGRYHEVTLNLQSALRVDPTNFNARATMANIQWVQGNYAFAHEAFTQLLKEYPARRTEIARNWLPKLLVFAENERIKSLALTMLASDEQAAGAWTHALVYAARQTEDSAVLVEAMRLPRLPEPIRPVLAAVAAGLSGQREAAVGLLASLEPKGPHAQFIAYQQLEGLLELGAAERALDLLDTRVTALSPADALFFRLCANRRLGWDEMTAATIRGAFQQIDLPRLNALGIYLVRHHDRAGLERVLAALEGAPEAPRLDVTFSILYLAAGLWGDRDLMPRIAKLATQKARMPGRLLEIFDLRARQPGRLNEAMGLLPIPMEAVYAAHRAMRTLPKK